VTTSVGSAFDLSERDRAVVELVGKFRQLLAGQIKACLFHDVASATPLDRTLKRLVERKHLSRLKRLVGGDQGGSGQFIYQLGRQGWRLLDRPGAYWAPQAVNWHSLAIADCYVLLKQAEYRGELEVVQFVTEPACHHDIGPFLLTPDAYVEVGSCTTKLKYSYWLEVDRGTEHLNKIEEKCVRYWRAFRAWQEEYFPTILFVVPDSARERAIVSVHDQGPVEARKLFSVCTRDHLVNLIP
jgi:hypothetical protein